MDIYRHYVNKQASHRRLVTVGRLTALVALVIACLVAPAMTSFDQMFIYIQEYTGLVSPGILAVFLMGLFWKKATNRAAIIGALVSIPVALALKFLPINMPFMDQMMYTCLITIDTIILVSLFSGKGGNGCWKKISNLVVLVFTLASIPAALVLSVDVPFVAPVCIGFITIATILLVCLTSRGGGDDAKGIVFSDGLFKTPRAFNISAYIICILLAVVYVVFW
jgi:hypothetical protein